MALTWMNNVIFIGRDFFASRKMAHKKGGDGSC